MELNQFHGKSISWEGITPKSAWISPPGALEPDSGRSGHAGSIREGPGARNGPPEAEIWPRDLISWKIDFLGGPAF